MLSYSTLGALLALSGTVAAIPYDGPVATPIAKRWSPQGWSPKPTSQPQPLLEMFKRQTDPAFCGYLEGDPEYAVTCRIGSSCMYDDLFSWFGCCTGTAVTDCDVITACVESTKLDECLSESSCANDPLAMACTDSEEPYCMGLYTVVSSSTYGHFECASADTTYEVIGSTVDQSFSSIEETPIFTLEPSSTRLRPSVTDTPSAENVDSTSTSDDNGSPTSDDSGSSTTEDSPFTFTRGGGGATETTATDSATATVADASSSSSSAGAMRTAQAVLGAAGGVAGLIAVLA